MSQSASYLQGRDAGAQWVFSTATPKQCEGLQRLTQILPRVRRLLDELANLHDGQNFDLATGDIIDGEIPTFADSFARAMLQVEGITGEPETFWQAAIGRGCPDAKFAHGFIVGAFKAIKGEAGHSSR